MENNATFFVEGTMGATQWKNFKHSEAFYIVDEAIFHPQEFPGCTKKIEKVLKDIRENLIAWSGDGKKGVLYKTTQRWYYIIPEKTAPEENLFVVNIVSNYSWECSVTMANKQTLAIVGKQWLANEQKDKFVKLIND